MDRKEEDTGEREVEKGGRKERGREAKRERE